MVARFRGSYLLAMIDLRVFGFEHLKELYVNVGESFKNPNDMFVVQEGFLFMENKLCIPMSGARKVLVREVHSGWVAEYFCVQKTLDTLNESFYWPNMMKDVHMVVISKCATCQRV